MEFEKWLKEILKELNMINMEDTMKIAILTALQEVKMNRSRDQLEKLLNNLNKLGFGNLSPTHKEIKKWIELGEIK
jgi:hypothetical protein